MTQTLSFEEISEKVVQAMDRARLEHAHSDRLLPFTEAQIRYIQGFVTQALAEVLGQTR